MYDINTYCPERRGADKYGVAEAGSYFVMSEVLIQYLIFKKTIIPPTDSSFFKKKFIFIYDFFCKLYVRILMRERNIYY